MNTLRDNLIASIDDPTLQKRLRQLADACDQTDTATFTTTLAGFKERLNAHGYRGLQPLTERLQSLLEQQAPADDLNQLITVAAAYVKLLQDQQIEDHPLVVVQILKQCRFQAAIAELVAEDWLIPDIRPARVRPVRTPEIDVEPQRLAAVFQVLLLRWLQRNDLPALKRLAQICRYLRSRSHLPQVMLLWQTAEALAIALSESALTDPADAQRVLGKLTTAIRTQTEQDEATLQRNFPERLLRQLLMEIAKADSDHNLIVDLQHTQQLNFIKDQQRLVQTLGWSSTSRQPESVNPTNTDQRLEWLEQMDSALDQYHQHLHRWFKQPTEQHQQALLNTLIGLQTDAEKQSLPTIARLYQLMQQLLSVSPHSSEPLTDLLEQAYQQLNQQVESLFENQSAPDIAPFAAMVDAFVSSQKEVSENQPLTSTSDDESSDSAFILDADEHLQSIQTELKHWQASLPSPPPEALIALFNELSSQARIVQQHAIADLADGLSVLLKQPQAPTEWHSVFDLTAAGQSKLSDMQEQLAQDLPVSPAFEQLAAISDFIKMPRRRKTPSRTSKSPTLPALSNSTLTSLKSRQRSSQQAMQTIADQHLLLMQQLLKLQNQQPDLASEMQRTLTKAQSAVNAQIHNQAIAQQTLATATLQPVRVICAAIENQIELLNQHRHNAVVLAFESDDGQLPDFMVRPLTEALDNLLRQLLATDSDSPLTLEIRIGSQHANICLEINLLSAGGMSEGLPSITETEKNNAEKFLHAIGGQVKLSSSRLQLQLPRVEQPLRCLVTRCGDKFFAIVAEAIDSISHVNSDAFDYQPGESMSYQHNGTTCQLVSPERLTGNAGHIISDGQPVIITHDHKQPVAVTVDEVINTQNCVFELLGPQLTYYPTLRGVSISQGQLLMLLDTDALKTPETETVSSAIT